LELLDQATFEGYIRVVPQLLSFDRTRGWWNNYRETGTYDPEFVKYVEELLAKTPKADLQGMMEKL
jgi:hypothetical protein